jgi:peptide/nickel transport system permease protein
MTEQADQIITLRLFASFDFRRNWPIWFALLFALLSLLCLIGFIGKDWTSIFEANLSPSSAHWLGTNSLGQDLGAHVLQALAGLLMDAIPGAIFGLMCGLFLGLFAAVYVDTVADRIVLWLIDVFEAMPVVIVLILLAALLKNSALSQPIIFAMLFWSSVARAVRAAAISALAMDCVDAARAMGQNMWQLMFWQLLPMLRPLCVALSLVLLGNCLRVQMVLGFLGLDQSARPSLGGLLNVATDDALSGQFWPLALILSISVALLISVEFLVRRSELD